MGVCESSSSAAGRVADPDISVAGGKSVPPRPSGAEGTFLRVVTVNDVYVLDNYPKVATAVRSCKDAAAGLDCVVASCINGDFISPCTISALDNGHAMMLGLNQACLDYACLGNHEFDLGFEVLAERVGAYKGQIINSNVKSDCVASCPRYHVLEVGSRKALLAGCVLGDTSIYSAGACPVITPVTEALKSLWLEGKTLAATPPDILLPMTHQLLADDELTAEALNEVEGLSGRVPVILGGHEHEILTPVVSGTRIVKMGQDAITVGIVDIWWDKDGKAQSSLVQVPAKDLPDEAGARAWVEKQHAMMEEMLKVAIMRIPWQCSSKMVRYEPSKMASLLLQLIKEGENNEKVELVMTQAGGIRAARDYEAGDFTLEDLYAELPFDLAQAIVRVPGKILAETVKASRSPEGEKPGYVHLDLDAEVNADNELTMINREPLDLSREYVVSTDVLILKGMNNIEPLLTYVKSGAVRVPDEEECKPAKQIIISACMRVAWRQLLDLPGGEVAVAGGPQSGGGGQAAASVSRQELRRLVREKFHHLDKDGNGFLAKEEVLAGIRNKKMDSRLLEHMVPTLDTSGDDKISLQELMTVCQ